jgi:hypothetical protein
MGRLSVKVHEAHLNPDQAEMYELQAAALCPYREQNQGLWALAVPLG